MCTIKITHGKNTKGGEIPAYHAKNAEKMFKQEGLKGQSISRPGNQLLQQYYGILSFSFQTRPPVDIMNFKQIV